MDNFENHIPKASIPLIKKWIKELNILVKIKKSRNTKLGDFTVNKKETDASGDVIKLMQDIGYIFKGKIGPELAKTMALFTRYAI